jgi:head-tail adaptor
MNDEELQDMRDAALLLMNDVATIERFTEVQDGLDTVTTYADHLTNVPCRIAEQQSQGDRENVVAGRLVSQGEHVVRFPYGTDVHESDRIRIRVNRQDRVFEVSRVLEHSYATTTSVACSEAR